MRTRMRPYLSAFRIRAQLELQYRGAALGGIVTQAFFGLVLVFLYQTLYADGDAQRLGETITYVWLQQSFFRAMFAGESELNAQIMSGSVAYSLVRPVDQQLWWSCRDLAGRCVGCLMRMAPMLAVQLLLPASCRMSLPESPTALLQFMFSITLGMLCLTQIGSITSAFTMMTLDPRGVASILQLTMAFLSGNVIPLTMFPESLQSLMRWQPFAQALDAPIRMYLHAQPLPEFLISVTVQTAWLAAMTLLARRLWRAHLDRLVIQGG